jgi:hypothetical protein
MTMATRGKKGYVVCLSNGGYKASLEMRKIYVVLADAEAKRHGMLRVVDESGEDYLYPEECFAKVSLPAQAQRVFRSSA